MLYQYCRKMSMGGRPTGRPAGRTATRFLEALPLDIWEKMAVLTTLFGDAYFVCKMAHLSMVHLGPSNNGEHFCDRRYGQKMSTNIGVFRISCRLVLKIFVCVARIVSVLYEQVCNLSHTNTVQKWLFCVKTDRRVWDEPNPVKKSA